MHSLTQRTLTPKDLDFKWGGSTLRTIFPCYGYNHYRCHEFPLQFAISAILSSTVQYPPLPNQPRKYTPSYLHLSLGVRSSSTLRRSSLKTITAPSSSSSWYYWHQTSAWLAYDPPEDNLAWAELKYRTPFPSSSIRQHPLLETEPVEFGLPAIKTKIL